MSTRLEAVHPVLMSSNLAVSEAFYSLLGFKLVFQDKPSEPAYMGISRDGVALHLQRHDPAQWACNHDRPTYRLVVQDVDALFREFQEAGVFTFRHQPPSPWASPGNTPWGTREFHVLDPDGNGLQFYRPLAR